ncbi:diguanylate cyclase (GGDEF)-like protein [Sphingomonas sp. UYAg733]
MRSTISTGRILARPQQWLRQLARQWSPPVPVDVCDNMLTFQFSSIHRQIPTLHLAALINIVIVDYVLWHQHTPVRYYGWTAGVALFSLFRMVMWHRRRDAGGNSAALSRFLRGTNIAATGSVALVSGFSAFSYAGGGLDFPLLIPISLAFGAFSIAHCLAPLRFASIAALLVGILPTAMVMFVSGNFMAMVLAVSMTSVALLKIGFLRDYHRQMVAMLVLHRRVETLANADTLTGLANRRAICEAIEDALADAEARGDSVTVALVDLDGFKAINDTHGHHVGDALLRVVGERLTEHAGPGAKVGRLGGDEFVLMLREKATALSIDARLTGVIARLCQPAQIEELTIKVSGSLGFASSPAGGRDLDTLLRAADEALYAAKRSGKGRALSHTAARRAA